jgi:hypothetical protein
MANQFTKGTRKRHDEHTKDKIRAEQLSRRLFKFAKAKGEKVKENDMTQGQVAAARVLIERGKPALQAIEQTNINPLDTASPEEIQEQVKALITSRPELLMSILDADPGLRAAILSHITRQPAIVSAA